MSDVIVALATAPIKCALHLIRLSGDGVFSMSEEIFSKKLVGLKEKSIFFGTISDDGNPIDEVVLFAYPKPHTMTGEDVVEITCHGSVLIANQIIGAYLKRGAHYAERGEFSSRAFYNGKMDLIEAEAINDLINAPTIESKNISLMSLSGSVSKIVLPLKKRVSDLLALAEVNIDYPEYTDLEEANDLKILTEIKEIRAEIQRLIKEGLEGKIIKDGVNIAIVGAPNVGKSSLLNALMKEEKAIVSDIPGTTRDVVEGSMSIRGIPVRLMDTAGIREGAGKLEKLGIERSAQSIEKADLVLLVYDASKGLDEESKEILKTIGDKPHLLVANKTDLKSGNEGIEVSAKNGDIVPLLDGIQRLLGVDEKAYTTPSLNNERQLNLLREIDAALAQAEDDASKEAPIDLISGSLLNAYNGFRKLLGEETTLDLTDEIFSRFCVGK